MRGVAGIFNSVQAAEEARRQLLASGVGSERISVSSSSLEDGIAGEAPGQSYENQPGQGSGTGWFGRLTGRGSAEESRAARYGEAVRSGACVLSVEVASRQEQKRVAFILERRGASHVSERFE